MRQVLLAQLTGLRPDELAAPLHVFEVEVCKNGSLAIDREQFETLLLVYEPGKPIDQQRPTARAIMEKIDRADVSLALEEKRKGDYCGLYPDAMLSYRKQTVRRAKFQQLKTLEKAIVLEEESKEEETVLSAAASRLEAKMGRQYRALVRALRHRGAHSGDNTPSASDLSTPYSPENFKSKLVKFAA